MKFLANNINYSKLIMLIFMLIVSIIILVPFVWMAITSVKSMGEIFAYPPAFIPDNIVWENFVEAWNLVPLGRYLLNSFVVAFSITILHLTVASLAAYAFARLEFPGRNILFLLFLATLMIPGQVTMIPNFIILRFFGLLNTYTGLIIPEAFTALGVFLLRQFFINIPKDYEDSARIDGASRFYIYRKIIIPMSKPALATLGIFTFVFQWNNLLWPLIVVSEESMNTLTVGLASFQGQYATRWDLLMAAALIGIVPSVFVYMIGQKHIIKGITLSGLD